MVLPRFEPLVYTKRAICREIRFAGSELSEGNSHSFEPIKTVSIPLSLYFVFRLVEYWTVEHILLLGLEFFVRAVSFFAFNHAAEFSTSAEP